MRALPEIPGSAGQASYRIRLEEPKSVGHNDLVDSNGKGTRILCAPCQKNLGEQGKQVTVLGLKNLRVWDITTW